VHVVAHFAVGIANAGKSEDAFFSFSDQPPTPLLTKWPRKYGIGKARPREPAAAQPPHSLLTWAWARPSTSQASESSPAMPPIAYKRSLLPNKVEFLDASEALRLRRPPQASRLAVVATCTSTNLVPLFHRPLAHLLSGRPVQQAFQARLDGSLQELCNYEEQMAG
jgi:hypothetical protein